ncbi:hypothetical protein QFZ37_000169 [Chryseobacterium ginsenosidimutans]|uniref:hypothetical protein n=1 Tax=Chryseobacterium ginsenosidimutans TaxID=687846 RepID=UPI0027808AC2|nr:hypothetical protein [Chryseobacterium ginsenosidimutans]MDQ0591800.1 hypothetical protein [Chryseobacterium ginsenosidimutans]
MKKIILVLCLLVSYNAFCQERNTLRKLDESAQNEVKKIISEEITDKKSANLQDVIANYFLLALKDLGGEKQEFELKTTLFNLKAQANKDLWADYNYEKENFSRNFQIEAGLSLKNDNKINAFTYGFGWSYNRRDRSINTLVNSKSAVIYENYKDDLTNAQEAYSYYLEKMNDSQREEKIIKIKATKDKYKSNENEIKIIPLTEFSEDFRRFLSEKYESYSENFIKQNKSDIETIGRKPYFFIGVNNSLNDQSKILDDYKIHAVFLKGIKSQNVKMEIDFRNSYKVYDSIETITYKRKEFSSQLGLNISIMAKEISFIELKPNFEYKRIFSGLMDDEKNNQFLANADLRVRILKNLWVPLILKYDIENGKFFGFLNVSFNFDAVKKE